MVETVKETGKQRIVIRGPNRISMVVPIWGMTELIVHNFSQKARNQIRETVTGTKPKMRVRENRDPEEEYQASKYMSTEGWEGVPCNNFKSALIEYAHKDIGFSKVQAKKAIFIEPDGFDANGEGLVKIIGDSRMREDMVRLSNGSADIRWRAAYAKWGATLRVLYDADVLDQETVINWINRAGEGGICEWRPTSKTAVGDHGMFKVLVPGDD